jgi:hypothetical protein
LQLEKQWQQKVKTERLVRKMAVLKRWTADKADEPTPPLEPVRWSGFTPFLRLWRKMTTSFIVPYHPRQFPGEKVEN